MSEYDDEIQIGEEVQNSEAPRSVLLAARVPIDLAVSIDEYARGRGISVSEVIRRGVQQLISGTDSQGTAIASTWDARTMVVQGDRTEYLESESSVQTTVVPVPG